MRHGSQLAGMKPLIRKTGWSHRSWSPAGILACAGCENWRVVLDQPATRTPLAPLIDKDELLRLSKDLPSVWICAEVTPGLKQRIIRILIQEIVADVDEQCSRSRVGGSLDRRAPLRRYGRAKPKSGSSWSLHEGRSRGTLCVRWQLNYTDEEIAFTYKSAATEDRGWQHLE